MAAMLGPLALFCFRRLQLIVEGAGASTLLGLEDELRGFKKRLLRLQGFLDIAEQNRHESATIGAWVMELKDAIYDADGIFDLYNAKTLELLRVSGKMSPSLPPSPFIHDVSIMIKGINLRLDDIFLNTLVMPKLECSRKIKISSSDTSSIETGHVVDAKIEGVAEEIVDSLSKDDKHKCEVFSIVGMAQVGKTALARNVYNDQRIKAKFGTRVWLYVSKKYSEKELLSVAIRDAGGDLDGAQQSRAELEPKLASLLLTNFLLVLDDVWTANAWDNLLRVPAECGKATGKILFTTRD